MLPSALSRVPVLNAAIFQRGGGVGAGKRTDQRRARTGTPPTLPPFTLAPPPSAFQTHPAFYRLPPDINKTPPTLAPWHVARPWPLIGCPLLLFTGLGHVLRMGAWWVPGES